MSPSKKKPNLVRREEEISNWSELSPDLLRCVFRHLSFTNLNRAKSVCSSWHSASRGCIPKPNHIPWLILFPSYNFNKNSNNSSSCVLFVPEDKDKVYITRDLGFEFVMSRCLATYGIWLLMLHPLYNNLYILNPLSGERIDLPNISREHIGSERVFFGIDNKTKDYLVVSMNMQSIIFTKKGDNKWHDFPVSDSHKEIVYNHKDQKLYIYYHDDPLKIWDFSGDKPCQVGFLDCFRENHYDFEDSRNLLDTRHLVVTVSGDVLIVACSRLQDYKTWRFRIYKANHVNHEWVEIDSLGDEALILDMGVTVVAKYIQGIKRNSIYFSGVGYGRMKQDDIFVLDLTTQKIEPLPQCVFSSIQFSDARWFFPGFNG